MKTILISLLSLFPYVLSAQTIVKDVAVPKPEVAAGFTERKCYFNLSVGNTMLLDTALTSFAGKRNFLSFGTGFIFLNPETSKVRPFVNLEFLRYTQTYGEDKLPKAKVRSFNFSAGLNIPFKLSESQFLYLATALNHGEINNSQPNVYSRYFGAAIGLGLEKRINPNFSFFAEVGFNKNRSLRKYLQQNEPYNLNTFCLKTGFRL